MVINTDINILGGLPDFDLVNHFLFRNKTESESQNEHFNYTSIKTDKSVKRFERAIIDTFLRFKSNKVEILIKSILAEELITENSLQMLFWNSSVNNDLLHYLNSQVYFPSFYTGKLVIKKEEVSACIKELKESEKAIQNWTIITIDTLSGKYLTLLKKFKLMEGVLNKTIIHPYLNDKMFVLFIYWLSALDTKSNLLESEWLKYSFCELSIFIERVLQKKFSKFFHLNYTGDKLKIETSIPYENIYDAVK